MEKVWYGLQVTVVGMLVVFIGLVVLIGCIRAMRAVMDRFRGDAAKASRPEPAAAPQAAAMAAPQAPAAPIVYTPGPHLTSRDDALYAVIAATLARTLADEGINPEGGFRLRAVKPLNEAKPGPALTRKDDALYAVITAALAQVLLSEGINPEGGFKITSVKALS